MRRFILRPAPTAAKADRHRPVEGVLQPSAASPGPEQPTTDKRVARRLAKREEPTKAVDMTLRLDNANALPTHSSDRKKEEELLVHSEAVNSTSG